MYKLIIFLIAIIPLIAHAEETEPFPSTARGIHIIPQAKEPSHEARKILSNKAEENKIGYVENNDDDYAGYLLNLKRDSVQEIRTYKNNNDTIDTHLKNASTDIKLSFPFKTSAAINERDIIGYAPIGTYIKEEKSEEGWSGIKVFFTNSNLGTCAYSYQAIKAVELNEETTEYLVNHKPSSKIILKNNNSGFVYTLNWYTDTTMSILDCANKIYDKNIMASMIVLANKIDRN